MKLVELIDALDQRYGNPYAAKECGIIQDAVIELKNYQMMDDYFKEHAPMEYQAYRNTYGLEVSATESV